MQAKTKIGKSGDSYEREADRVADSVLNQSPDAGPTAEKITPLVRNNEAAQRSEEGESQAMEEQSEGQSMEEPAQKEAVQKMEDEAQGMGDEDEAQAEEPVQKSEDEAQSMGEETESQSEDDPVQTKEDVQEMADESQAMTDETQQKGGPPIQKKSALNVVPGKVDKLLKNTKGKGSPLPENVRGDMEAGFGVDFSQVRIHTGTEAMFMTGKLGALAFAHGKDIYFKSGTFDPNSKKGRQLLAHELTHTVQQGAAKIKSREDGPPTDASQPDLSGSTTQAPASPQSTQSVAQPEKEDLKATQLATNSKDSAKKGADTKAPEGDKIAQDAREESTTPRSPEEDPNFQALQERSKTIAKKQKSHPPSKSVVKNAGDSASSPDNEAVSQAQEQKIDAMEKEEPKSFDAASFKKLLLDEIKKVLPKNEDEADDFAKSNKMEQVKEAASGKVKEERGKAEGGIKTASEAELKTSEFPKRVSTELKVPNKGKKPADLQASKAMPSKRTGIEVSTPLQENAKGVDDEMAQNEVTEEQLAKSEEPKFLGALDSKKTAQDHSTSAPNAFRKEENTELDKTQKQADKKGKKQLDGMHGDRHKLFGAVAARQKNTQKDNTSERDRIAKDIDNFYLKAKGDVETRLKDLDPEVEKRFADANKIAKDNFEQFVDKKMDKYKDDRYGSWYNPVGLVRRAGDAVTGLPNEVNKFFTEGRERYINQMDVALTSIASYIAAELTSATKRIEKGKADVKKYVNALPKNLKKFGKEAADNIEDKFSQLSDKVASKQDELISTLAQKYKESLGAIDARIKEMKAANRGLIGKAIDAVKGVIETIKKLKKMLSELLAGIRALISYILSDPIGFMKQLFSGIGQGIANFSKNILKHLTAGLLKWLTGAMGPMGITMPENIFSLSGIFNLIMQVLGLGWDYLRKKAIKLLGEKAVMALEKGFALFQLFREKGVDGIWEHLKEKFADLKESVMGAIQNMIITQVIMAGVKWIAGLLIPGAGFIKAAIAIKDLIVFFVETAFMLIPTITKAIKSLASGSVKMVAKAIEDGLVLLLPMVINLFAKLIGLSGLVGKVQKIIKRIRKRIDKQVNKVLMKAKRWVKKMFKKGKKGVKKDDKVKPRSNKLGKVNVENKISMSGQKHRLIGKVKKGRYRMYMASDPELISNKLKTAIEDVKQSNRLSKEKDEIIAKLIKFDISVKDVEFEANAEINEITKGAVGPEGMRRAMNKFIFKKQVRIGRKIKKFANKHKIKSLKDFFSKRPQKRLIDGSGVGKFIRKELYDGMNSNEWKSARETIISKQYEHLLLKVRDVQHSKDQLAWDDLKVEGLILKNSDVNDENYKPAKIPYEVDHVNSVSNLWNNEGYNTNDKKRQKSFVNLKNLKLVTEEFNRSKGGEQYSHYVGPKFRSEIAHGNTENAGKILDRRLLSGQNKK